MGWFDLDNDGDVDLSDAINGAIIGYTSYRIGDAVGKNMENILPNNNYSNQGYQPNRIETEEQRKKRIAKKAEYENYERYIRSLKKAYEDKIIPKITEELTIAINNDDVDKVKQIETDYNNEKNNDPWHTHKFKNGVPPKKNGFVDAILKSSENSLENEKTNEESLLDKAIQKNNQQIVDLFFSTISNKIGFDKYYNRYNLINNNSFLNPLKHAVNSGNYYNVSFLIQKLYDAFDNVFIRSNRNKGDFEKILQSAKDRQFSLQQSFLSTNDNAIKEKIETNDKIIYELEKIINPYSLNVLKKKSLSAVNTVASRASNLLPKIPSWGKPKDTPQSMLSENQTIPVNDYTQTPAINNQPMPAIPAINNDTKPKGLDMYIAVFNGDVEAVKKLLNENADYKTRFNYTFNVDPDSNEAYIYTESEEGETPLELAIAKLDQYNNYRVEDQHAAYNVNEMKSKYDTIIRLLTEKMSSNGNNPSGGKKSTKKHKKSHLNKRTKKQQGGKKQTKKRGGKSTKKSRKSHRK